ncbi:hypothetical protein F5Y11DRAFT_320356 [Daldinia sp. FL1419]|nr:hypothetical protein F5Y11DRAFT_320356 [Daldinia sp. FL1419]
MGPLHRDIIDHLTQDLDIPAGVIARYKRDHPRIKNINYTTMGACDINGSLSILVNAGAFQDALTILTFAGNIPLLGSPANLLGTSELLHYDLIRDVLKLRWDIELPPDPEMEFLRF